jgi:hypothetical protein
VKGIKVQVEIRVPRWAPFLLPGTLTSNPGLGVSLSYLQASLGFWEQE